MSNLSELRQQIDKLDRRLIKLIGKRELIVREIDRLKKTKKLPPYDAERWREMIANRCIWAKENGLKDDLVKKIFKSIHKWSLDIQSKK